MVRYGARLSRAARSCIGAKRAQNQTNRRNSQEEEMARTVDLRRLKDQKQISKRRAAGSSECSRAQRSFNLATARDSRFGRFHSGTAAPFRRVASLAAAAGLRRPPYPQL